VLALRSLLAAIVVAGGLLAGSLHAQDAEQPAADASDSAAKVLDPPPAATPPAGPDIFLLPDESGQLRRVLGYRYEDFFKAWQANGASVDPSDRPAFSIDKFEMSATEEGDALRAEVTIELELQDDGWVEAPLQLPSLMVESSKIEGGADRDFVTFDARKATYAAWFKGKPGDRRTVRLIGQLPIERDGARRRLTLELPAARASVVTLQTSDDAKLETPSSAQVTHTGGQQGQSQSRIVGAKGKLVATWGDDTQPSATAADLEAVTDAIVTVTPGRVTYIPFIRLNNLGEPIEKVIVRLPPGATAPMAEDGVGYSYRPTSGDKQSAHSEVEVVFDRPTSEPPLIRMTVEQPAAAGGAVLRVGAFEVMGAFRQSGCVAVRVSDELHAHFELDGQIQQIEPSALPEELAEEPPFAAFQTVGAAWAAEVHTQPRQRKVTVEPTYRLHLDSQGAALDVSLNYLITGGPLFEVRLDLRGWELTEQNIESGGAVNTAEQHVTPEGVLILPMAEADVEQIRLRFRLRREAGLGVHDLPLPEAQGAFVLPGELTVTCDDAWNASAVIERSVGVSPVDHRTDAGAVESDPSATSSSGQPPLRLQAFLPQSRVTLDVSERDQVIEVASDIAASFDGRTLNAEQRLTYDIRYQPATLLSATVTSDLLSNEGLELLLNGNPLASTAVDVHPLDEGEDGVANRADSFRLVVDLPELTVGKAVLLIRSHLALSQTQLSGASPIKLPLALPDQSVSSTATVQSSTGSLRVELANDGNLEPWTLSSSQRATLAGEEPDPLRVTTTRRARSLSLRLASAKVALPVEIRIEAAWVQTWIAGGMRQDRVVYRLHTSGPEVAIALPSGFEIVEVLLDRRVVPVSQRRPGVIVVELPASEAERSHTLELRRHTPLQLGAWGKQAVAFPRVEGADAWSPFFWQLVLPPDLAALATPSGMSAEYRLGWQGVRWGREPTQSQRDLERWTNATQAPAPGPRTNQYVYSAFEPPPSVEFVAIRRIWLVVAAGLTVFVIGLAWLYTSLARSAAFWLGLCVATAALLFVYPEAVILLVQAVILGGAFTVLSAVTQWLVGGARPRKELASTAPSSVSLAATQPWVADAPVGGNAPSASDATYQATSATP
jgi:hypothetical protein